MEAIFNGDDDALLIWDGEGYRPIACVTSSGVEKTTSFRERVTKCAPGETEVSPSTIARTMSVDGLLFDTTSVGGVDSKASYDYLDTKVEAKEKVTIKNTLGTLTPVYFDAYIESLSRTSPAGEDITFTASLRILGAPVTVDPNA